MPFVKRFLDRSSSFVARITLFLLSWTFAWATLLAPCALLTSASACLSMAWSVLTSMVARIWFSFTWSPSFTSTS